MEAGMPAIGLTAAERTQPGEPGHYWDKGDLAVVGGAFAVADLRFWKSAGLTGWLLWAGVRIYFLIGFTNRLFVMLRWMVQFATRRHGVGAVAEQTRVAAQKLDKAGRGRRKTQARRSSCGHMLRRPFQRIGFALNK